MALKVLKDFWIGRTNYKPGQSYVGGDIEELISKGLIAVDVKPVPPIAVTEVEVKNSMDLSGSEVANVHSAFEAAAEKLSGAPEGSSVEIAIVEPKKVKKKKG